jgi:hypothetical protein
MSESKEQTTAQKLAAITILDTKQAVSLTIVTLKW